MVDWIEKRACTGCAACVNVCPVDAISMREDSSGFLYPEINMEKCIRCDRCKKTCTSRTVAKNGNSADPRTYACWSRNEETRYISTSGGAFSEIVAPFIREGGVVSAAEYGKDNLVNHTIINTIDDVMKIRQSKYIQSEIGQVYAEIRGLLRSGKKVLFCGAPCQFSGLYSDVGEKQGLYTVDFICRGVNSPKAYLAWIKEIEHKQKSIVTRVWFKYKKYGWKLSPRCTRVDFENGKYKVYNQENNVFMEGYLSYNLYMRPSCGQCEFKGVPRQADLTLADFWGIDENLSEDKGTSLLLVNSSKGEELLSNCRENMVVYERGFQEIVGGNKFFGKSVSINTNSDAFLKALDKMSFTDALKKYTNYSVVEKIKRLIKRSLKKVLK